MSAADVQTFAAALPARPQDAEHLARELVRQVKLTAFQAPQIDAGKGKVCCWELLAFRAWQGTTRLQCRGRLDIIASLK